MKATTLLLVLFLSSTLTIIHGDKLQGSWTGTESHSEETWTLTFKGNIGNSTNGKMTYYTTYTVTEVPGTVYTLDAKLILPKEYAGQITKGIYRVNEFGFLNFGANGPNEPRPESFADAGFYLVAFKSK